MKEKDSILSEIRAAKSFPESIEIECLNDAIEQLEEVESTIDFLEGKLKELKKLKNSIIFKDLPDYMNEIGVQEQTLSSGVSVKNVPYYKASIPKERQEEAFGWLIDNGHGDLIKSTYSVNVPRESFEIVQDISNLILQEYQLLGEVSRKVAWNTLTAFVREQYTKGEELPLGILGATIGTMVKIERRK